MTELTRFSLDYRYHGYNPDNQKSLDWFYSVKDSLPLCKEGDPDFKPDWEGWATVNRNVIDKEGKVETAEEQVQENFDDVITGPWMDLWDILGPSNRHT